MISFKKAVAVLLLATSLTGLAACGQSSDESNQIGQESSGQNAGAQDQNGRRNWGNNSPDIYGEVKSISGSKLKLALIEIPQRRQPSEEELQQMKERRQNSQDGFNGEQNQDQSGRGPENGPGGQGGDGFNGPPPGRNDDAVSNIDPNGNGNNGNDGNGRNRRDGQGFGGVAQRKLTGENLEIEIPSSASITTFERGNNDLNEKKIKVEDIKVGMTVQIWYKKDNGDKKEIETIRVMQAPSPRPTGTPAAVSTQNPSQKS
jgi:hypothetical protein